MRIILKRFNATKDIVSTLINHFKLNPESSDKFPKIHAITYYTKAESFKMTWAFANESDMNKACDWAMNKISDSAEIYSSIKDGFYVTVKFHGPQKIKDLKAWIGVEPTKCYFADQDVYRFYIN